MGTENPKLANHPARPTAEQFPAPQNASQFSSSDPVTGAETSAFRPSNSVASSQVPPFFSRPLAGPKAFGFRPVLPGKSNDPAGPTPPFSYRPPNTEIFQHSPSPQFSSTGQGPPPGTFLRDQPVIAPRLIPPVGL